MIPAGILDVQWPVIHFEEIDSTSLEAARIAERGQLSPVWLRADAQTGGKGRLGRPWVSNPGNLYTTVLLPLENITADVPCLALVAGLAVFDTVQELTEGKVKPGLKWPNDVRIDGAKLCGILLESGRNSQGELWLSIGMGLNLAHSPDIEAYRTANIKDHYGKAPTPESALAALEVALKARFRQIMMNGRSSVIADWMAVTDQMNQHCRVVQRGHPIEGVFVGLDDHGLLQMKLMTGEIVTVTAGDVELVKEAPNAARD